MYKNVAVCGRSFAWRFGGSFMIFMGWYINGLLQALVAFVSASHVEKRPRVLVGILTLRDKGQEWSARPRFRRVLLQDFAISLPI